jgi:hypothetical protein
VERQRPDTTYGSTGNFRRLINKRLTLNVSLKTEEDILAGVKFFNDAIKWAVHKETLKAYDCPILINQKIEEKRKTP